MLLKFSTLLQGILYLDDLLINENPCFEQMVYQIYPAELQSSDTEAPFLDLDSSINNIIVSSEIYDKRAPCQT